MKLWNHTIFALAGITTALVSCQKQYEPVPVEQTTLAYAFDTQDSAGVMALDYLSGCYLETFTDGHNRIGAIDYLDAASDDAISASLTVSGVQQIATGAYSAATPNADDDWTQMYAAIRDNTIFINDIYRVPLNEKLPNGQPALPTYRSEARFLRAWAYLQLVKRYGGVPLLGDTVFTITTPAQVPRNSFSDCINYIVSECTNIQDSLRTVAMITGATYGRITQGAALALKTEALMLAASPLYNGGNIAPSNPLTGYTNYDATRWQLAAQAAQAVMNSGIYSLMSNFEDVFITQAQPVGANTESIYWMQVGQNTSVETDNSPIGYSSEGARGYTSPTQNLVDAFPTDSGYAITDPASGYDPANPYNNRDPRLLSTIFCNGVSLWLNRYVQTYDGGLDKPGGTVVQTKTGYYMRKFMGDFEQVTGSPQFGSTVHDWIYCRYAGILLDFAEATNEFSGPSSAVYNVLFQLRQRAGIFPGTNGYYGLPMNMDQPTMRAAIQNERRCEMAFEEQRFFDIRRWQIASAAYNTAPLVGMDIQYQPNQPLTYNRVPVLTTSFKAPAMYLYPIPYSQVVKDPQMQQNPGW
jgi:starch-binding outer membrane protein, SusD/RagB family